MMKLEGSGSIHVVVLLCAIISIFICGLDNHGLWSPDEPRVAEIGREMAETGNFVTPKLNQRPFLEEPPLYYASLALVFKLTGKASDGLARIPSLIYGMAGAFATFLIAYTLFGKMAGLISAFVLATAFEYFRVSHWVIVDSGLSCFIYFAMWSFIKAYLAETKGKRWLYYMLLYIFSSLAFFVKGFIGIGVPCLAILTFLIFDRNIREVFRMHLWAGILIFLLFLTPWVIGLYNQGGMDWLKTFFIENNFMRFLPGGKSGHHNPIYYYLTEFPLGFLPWAILLIPVFYYAFSKDKANSRKGLGLLMCWFISGFVLFSLSATKRILYLLPIFAPISILTAIFIEHTLNTKRLKRIEAAFLWVYGYFYMALGILLLPAILYITNRYNISIDTIDLFASGLTSATLIALSFLAILRLKIDDKKGFWVLSNAGLFLLLLVGLVWIAPEVDRYKSFKPFAMRVMATVAKDEPLYSYKPDETIRGFIPFYTGRYLKEIDDREGISALLRGDKDVYVVIRDKKGVLRRELIDAGFVEVIGYPTGRPLMSLLKGH